VLGIDLLRVVPVPPKGIWGTLPGGHPWPSKCLRSTITASASVPRRRGEEGLRLLPRRARASQPIRARPVGYSNHRRLLDGRGGTAQIHLMGVDGQSKLAPGRTRIPPGRTWPSRCRHPGGQGRGWTDMGVEQWVTGACGAGVAQQSSWYDPFGNMIELHQAGTCRCVTGNRQSSQGHEATEAWPARPRESASSRVVASSPGSQIRAGGGRVRRRGGRQPDRLWRGARAGWLSASDPPALRGLGLDMPTYIGVISTTRAAAPTPR